MTIRAILRTTKKSGIAPVYFRLSDGRGVRYFKKSNIYVDIATWKGERCSDEKVNKRITEMKVKILGEYKNGAIIEANYECDCREEKIARLMDILSEAEILISELKKGAGNFMPWRNIPIRSINIKTQTTRFHNIMSLIGINTVGELYDKTPSEILRYSGVGKKMLVEFSEYMKEIYRVEWPY